MWEEKKMLSVSIKSISLARVNDFPPTQTWSQNDLSHVSSLSIQWVSVVGSQNSQCLVLLCLCPLTRLLWKLKDLWYKEYFFTELGKKDGGVITQRERTAVTSVWPCHFATEKYLHVSHWHPCDMNNNSKISQSHFSITELGSGIKPCGQDLPRITHISSLVSHPTHFQQLVNHRQIFFPPFVTS